MPDSTTDGVCGMCGVGLTRRPRGRPRQWCSDRCRQRAYRARHQQQKDTKTAASAVERLEAAIGENIRLRQHNTVLAAQLAHVHATLTDVAFMHARRTMGASAVELHRHAIELASPTRTEKTGRVTLGT